METIDLSFLEAKPDLSRSAGRLEVSSLCPVSMASAPPGRSIGTELEPLESMLYGAVENAMGMHFGWDKSGSRGDPEPQGYYLLDQIAERSAADIDLGYYDRNELQPLVAPYYSFDLISAETGETFYDLRWRKKWRGDTLAQSGQTNDYGATTFDKSEPASLHGYQRALARREYVEGEWAYQVFCSEEAEEALAKAIESPKAPLYLGSSDGWAHFSFRSGS